MYSDYNALSHGATTRHGREIMLGPQWKACLAMRQLEDAVLEFLFEAKRNGEGTGVAEISRRAGIWSGRGRGRGVPGERRRRLRRQEHARGVPSHGRPRRSVADFEAIAFDRPGQFAGLAARARPGQALVDRGMGECAQLVGRRGRERRVLGLQTVGARLVAVAGGVEADPDRAGAAGTEGGAEGFAHGVTGG